MAMPSHLTQAPEPTDCTSRISTPSTRSSIDFGDHSDSGECALSNGPLLCETVERLQDGHEEVSVLLVRDAEGRLFARKVRTVGAKGPVMRREYDVMQSLRHPSIVRAFEYSLTESEESILMEYCSHFDLHSIIRQRKCLSECEAKAYFLSLSRALLYCHAHNLAHLDIKPENCFITEDGKLKLGDFGFAADITHRISPRPIGTQCYNSPEMLMLLPFDGEKADVFSLGMVLFYMVAGYRPFAQADMKSKEFKKWVYDRKLFWRDAEAKIERSLFRQVLFTPELKELIGAMLELQPKKRPTVAEVLSSAWLCGNVDFVLNESDI